tara:strand:- start:469 stop:756 length:288 start_codon:yes stop_codon:yes gene_type:complete
VIEIYFAKITIRVAVIAKAISWVIISIIIWIQRPFRDHFPFLPSPSFLTLLTVIITSQQSEFHQLDGPKDLDHCGCWDRIPIQLYFLLDQLIIGL